MQGGARWPTMTDRFVAAEKRKAMPDDVQNLRLDGQGKPLWVALELTYRCPLKC